MDDPDKVSEGHVIEAFHMLARQSLAEAKQDGLIDETFLQESSDEELKILGPALTLLFAAWRTVSNPPSVDVPASATNPAFSLSIATCPTNLLPLFRRWQRAVPLIQKLSTEAAADVARLICDLEPQTSPVSTLMVKLAADIQALAIQISQRRSFAERYTQDLEMALHREMATNSQQYNPPDDNHTYDETPSMPEPTAYQPQYPNHVPPVPARYNDTTAYQSSQFTPEHIPETQNEDVIAVRETLYAVLADVLSQSSSLGQLLRQDPARGYFTAVALAVIEAAMYGLTPDGQRVRVVALGRGRPESFGPLDAPAAYRVFVRAIVGLGGVLNKLQDEDTERMIELANSGQDDNMSLTRIEMLKAEIVDGAPDSDSIHDGESHRLRETAELRTVANQINRMALAVTSLPGFRDRVGVFQVLQGVCSGS